MLRAVWSEFAPIGVQQNPVEQTQTRRIQRRQQPLQGLRRRHAGQQQHVASRQRGKRNEETKSVMRDVSGSDDYVLGS